jgi:hypothetical protein
MTQEGNVTVTATTTETNVTGYVRSGLTNINSFSGGVSVLMTQETGEVPGYFSVSTTGISFSYESGLTDIFDIITNKVWSIIDYPLWINLDKLSGTTDDTILISTNSVNNIGVVRSGLTSVSGCTGVLNIVVTQDFEPIPPTPTVLQIEVLEQNSGYTISGATVTLYPSLSDWDSKTNMIVLGVTDGVGIVSFPGVTSMVYYVDVSEITHNNYVLRGIDSSYVTTPLVVDNTTTNFTAYVNVI